jgi:hypothetical protein
MWGLAVIGCAGCVNERTEMVLNTPSQARAAAEELHAGRTRVTIDGYRYGSDEVDGGWSFAYADHGGRVAGPWTLERLGEIRAAGSAATCPATDDYAARLQARGMARDPEYRVVPSLETWHTKPAPGVVPAVLGVGVVGAFAAAQVTCFADWCGTGGKVAFVVADAGLFVAGAAVAWIMIESLRRYR